MPERVAVAAERDGRWRMEFPSCVQPVPARVIGKPDEMLYAATTPKRRIPGGGAGKPRAHYPR